MSQQPFSSLPLPAALLTSIERLGYQQMTPVQTAALPIILAGEDLIARSRTGSGKTAAFGIGLLAPLNPVFLGCQALVLSPTRELATQTAEALRALARGIGNIKILTLCGGTPFGPQAASLEQGVHIVVGTPGRVRDHLQRGTLSLDRLNCLVLDEADRMLDIGFLPDLQRILSHLPKERTTLLFSATFSPEIKRLAGSYLQDPVTIEVARPNETASTVEQHFYMVGEDDKRRALRQVLKDREVRQAFFFVNSKLGCARLARTLERDGLKTTALHGDKSQDERLKALSAFKAGEVDLLVATDVAARGLDIKDVPAVFNFDVPFNAEDYVHRIGRTGRAGASGLAVTLVTKTDSRLIGELEKLLKKKLEVEHLAFEEEKPRGRFNDGRRAWHDDGDSPRERRGASERRSHSPAPAPSDPFFDRPYEPAEASEQPPAWESSARPARAGLSANIKPKRKVAALFKASAPGA